MKGASHELEKSQVIHIFVLSFFFFRAAPVAYGGSQAPYKGSQGRIIAVAVGLHHSHSHSKAGSKPYLQCTPQLMARPDP